MALDMLKKSTNIGLGLVALGQEKAKDLIQGFIKRGKDPLAPVKKLVADLEKKGKTNKGIGAVLIKNLLAKADEQIKKSGGLVEKTKSGIEQLTTRLNIPTKKDIAELNARIDKLLKK